MSHPSRPQSRGPVRRRRREYHLKSIEGLEDRCLLAPIVTVLPLQATFTPATTPTNDNLGTVTVTTPAPTTTSTYPTAAPATSVSELTPISAFGGDIVRIKAGPGGVFGKGVYAISRGAGDNAGAVNRPGVIYRVDPATGKVSVFSDLNTVIGQSNADGNSTGLVNWYDLAFDPEGYFDGQPSLFVASVDSSDPNKNAIYQINPDGDRSSGSDFVQFTTEGLASMKFNVNPTSILVPPVEDQSFLRGLIAGSGISSTGGEFAALFFDANTYTPGQNINTANLPMGVSQEPGLVTGPQVGLTAANADYPSLVYSAFTDFGTPAAADPARPQRRPGHQRRIPDHRDHDRRGQRRRHQPHRSIANSSAPVPLTPDAQPLVTTPFRRFEDVAFDQYGYFSQGITPTSTTTTSTGTTTTSVVPTSAGSLFVADLATGLSVQVTPAGTRPPRRSTSRSRGRVRST